MEVIIVVFMIMAVILFMGMLADKDSDNRRNFGQSFMVVVMAIVILGIFSKF